MTQERKALGRKMWAGPMFDSNPAPRIYKERAGQFHRPIIVFGCESDFEAAAREVWESGVHSIRSFGTSGLNYRDAEFAEIWPELKKRILEGE